MNAFVKKEIRSLLPDWLAVLLLAMVLPWGTDWNVAFAWTPLFISFGLTLLAVDSFGREFHVGTFQLLLSQPIERKKIWRTKIIILSAAAALILIACFISSGFLFFHELKTPLREVNWSRLSVVVCKGIFAGGLAASIAIVGGLWTTLLFRQIATAFWITFLAPAGLAMLIIFFLPDKATDKTVAAVFEIAALIYSIVGFWLAQKLFYRAQDAAWTGGVINFSRWRYFEGGSESSAARWRRPMRALFRKEFQLHNIALLGAGILLGLQVVVFFLRALYTNFHKNSTAVVLSDFFWVLWLVMPLIIGCMAVAEERRLGVADEQFCLPVSRRLQFLIKFVPTMLFGILIGGIMPLLLETIAKHLGDGSEIFTATTHPGNFFDDGLLWFEICVVALSAGFALAAFFASTLAKNFLQALSIAVVTIVGSVLFVGFVSWVDRERPTPFGITPWHSVLPVLIALLVVPTALIWLAYLNFNHFQENKRLWRRNVIGISGALLFVIVGSALIYNRAWEILEPMEPPHGAAKFSLASVPKLQSDLQDNLQVRFSDGRVWFDSLWDFYPEGQDSHWKYVWWLINRPLPRSAGPQRFMDGSNWISVAGARRVDFWNPQGAIQSKANHVHGYLDTVGIQADGSLWISSEAKPFDWTGAKMIRFGDETNWQQVVSLYGRSFLLLKTDGTLWEWRNQNFNLNGWQTNWPSVRKSKPQQIGTDSDWQEIFSEWFDLAKKTNGAAWTIIYGGKTNDVKLDRATNYDRVVFQNASFGWGGGSGYERGAYIGKNGTLWIRNIYLNISDENANSHLTGFLQVGAETNWLAVAINWDRMVALKTDGSLWQWPLDEKTTADVIKIPPTPLGIHHDWVGLTSVWQGIISLAADGSLWLWPSAESQGVLLKLPKQPELLGNVFSKTH